MIPILNNYLNMLIGEELKLDISALSGYYKIKMVNYVY